MLPWLALALLVLFLDQLTKVVIERAFDYGDVRPVTGFFSLVLTYNKGQLFPFPNAGGWQGKFLTIVVCTRSSSCICTRHGHQRLFALASRDLGG
jgi:signal peptidase II